MIVRPIALRVLSNALLAMVLITYSGAGLSAPGLTENELKAIFLLRLPQFVSWPEDQSETVFCVASAAELSPLLEEIVATDPEGREVRPLDPDQLGGCNVVFGSFNEGADRIKATNGVLWVSDQPGFARQGGMVELKRSGARMKLVINLDALESAGLKASSKLLQLSEVVGGRTDDA
jgi:hypothetical protein